MIINVVYGFLGAGKTTFIKYVMEHPPPGEKIVILVNEFGEIGIDGLLLSDSRGNVAKIIELPSGCICCTMASDFRRQVLSLYEQLQPDRLIIEPTGVATISQILQMLQGEDLKKLYSDVSLVHIIDASEFLSFFKSHRRFMENQITKSNIVVLNKIDRIKQSLVGLLAESIKEINPAANAYPTSFARLEPAVVNEILRIGERSDYFDENKSKHDPNGSHEIETNLMHNHDLIEQWGFAREFESFGKTYDQVFDSSCLDLFFNDMNQQVYGKVVRAKGVFSTPENWVKFELASGEVQVESGPIAKLSVISVIGQNIDKIKIEAKLDECLAK